MSNSERVSYVSFDQVPSPKGAAVHITEFVRALGRAFGDVDLVTPDSDVEQPSCERERWPGVAHYRLPATGGNLIDRALSFRRELDRYFTRRCAVVHCRSIFEGFPLALHKQRVADQLVFEVNGLPSIELKYHHPDVADDRELLQKLRAQESACLDAADLVLTPSGVTAAHLRERGVPADRIEVIPNGVHVDRFAFVAAGAWPADGEAPRAPRPARMLYAGTMSAWQGVHYAVEALALYRRDRPATLTLCGPTRGVQRRQLDELCARLGLQGAVRVVPPLSQIELAALHHEHDVVLAPLLANDRNLVQGCCPLKVLEAMASGTPLIASDLQVVRDLARADVEALLVRPGSGKAIKDAMLRLGDEPGLAQRLSRAARARVERSFTWKNSCRRLVASYGSLAGDRLGASSSSSAPSADTSALG